MFRGFEKKIIICMCGFSVGSTCLFLFMYIKVFKNVIDCVDFSGSNLKELFHHLNLGENC